MEDLVGVTVKHLVEHADHFKVGTDKGQAFKIRWLVAELEGMSAYPDVAIELMFEMFALLGLALL